MLDNYLKRYSVRSEIVKSPIPKNLGISIVIPSHAEEDISKSLDSLFACDIIEGLAVEVILVVNASEKDSEKAISLNQKTVEIASNYLGRQLNMHIIEELKLPAKKAGVGLARKIGMDEAARRLLASENSIKIIACFDADSQCEPNYLKELYSFFQENSNKQACSIYFEHPLEEGGYPKEVIEGIVFYEMHLRYYKNALKMANSPYGFHTIGSSMAVTVEGYLAQGGMNQRKAGEDFYFLQKFMKVLRLGELNSTKIIPSPRASNRVPFGTGRAIQEHLDGEREIQFTYNFKCFLDLKNILDHLDLIYYMQQSADQFKKLEEFYGKEEFDFNIHRIKQLSYSLEDFKKRFHQWFDAFTTLKFVHFLRDKYYPNKAIIGEVNELLATNIEEPETLLKELRKRDRN